MNREQKERYGAELWCPLLSLLSDLIQLQYHPSSFADAVTTPASTSPVTFAFIRAPHFSFSAHQRQDGWLVSRTQQLVFVGTTKNVLLRGGRWNLTQLSVLSPNWVFACQPHTSDTSKTALATKNWSYSCWTTSRSDGQKPTRVLILIDLMTVLRKKTTTTTTTNKQTNSKQPTRQTKRGTGNLKIIWQCYYLRLLRLMVYNCQCLTETGMGGLG